MKLKDVLKIMTDMQKVKIINKKKDDFCLYEGIKAGCIGEFCSSDLLKIYAQEDTIVAEVEYELSAVFTASDEELYDMFFDEDEADFDIAELERKMFSFQEDFLKKDPLANVPLPDTSMEDGPFMANPFQKNPFKENPLKGDLKDILSDFDF